jgi:hypothetical protein
MTNEYTEQADKFLADTGTTLTVTYQYTGPHFDDDKEFRDIYRFVLTNARGSYAANYGDSLQNTQRRQFAEELKQVGSLYVTGGDMKQAKRLAFNIVHSKVTRESYTEAIRYKPSGYGILACLGVTYPASFTDFCSEFGYDTGSRKALKTYEACKEEEAGLTRIFTSEQLEYLAEIN